MADCPDVVWPEGKLIATVRHVQLTLTRLLFQFQGTNQPTIQRLLRSYACQAQEIEQVLLDLCVARGLDDAVGAQLDGLGRIVGEARQGRSDVDYRTAIKGRIKTNKGHARIEDILLVFTQAMGGGFTFILTEIDPACVYLEVNEALTGPPIASPETLAALLKRARGAGICSALIYGTVPKSNRFTFANGDVPQVDALLGFSDDTQTTGGYWADIVS